MNKALFVLASLSMAITVILGALGAHALETVLSIDQLDSFKTGVRYQAWHSLALLVLAFADKGVLNAKLLRWAAMLFLGGIICFSFSIYLLALRDVLNIGGAARILGPITPVGGLLLISGWIFLAVSARGASVKKTLS